MKTSNLLSRIMRLRLWVLLCLLGPALAANAATWYFQGNGNNANNRAWSFGNSATTAISHWSGASSGGAPQPSYAQLPTNSAASPNFVAYPDLVFGTVLEGSLTTTMNVGVQYVHSLTFMMNGYVCQTTSATDMMVLGAGGGGGGIFNNPNSTAGVTTGGNAANSTKVYGYIELANNVTFVNYDTNQGLNLRKQANTVTGGANGANALYVDLKGYNLYLDGPSNTTITFTAPSSTGTPASDYAGGTIGDSVGTGSVIKNGFGIAALSSTNYYTGPTLVNAGQVRVTPYIAGGGSFTVADGGNLYVSPGGLAGAPDGLTANMSSLTMTNTGTIPATLTLYTNMTFSLGSIGNPIAPLIHATNLNLYGNVTLSVVGSGIVPGTIPLLKYDTNNGTGTFNVVGMLPGYGGYVTNDTALKLWKMVITDAPNQIWTATNALGVVNLNWNINANTNIYNTFYTTPTAYFNGLPMIFDDRVSAGNKNVNIAAAVSPYSILVSNTGTYTLASTLNTFSVYTNWIVGSTKILKMGSGTLILGTSNTYSGDTVITQGTLQLGADNAIGGKSTVTNYGTLDLNGWYEDFSDLNGSGSVINSSVNPATLTMTASAGQDSTFSGTISEALGGTISFNKKSGILRLTGNNNYSGGTIYLSGGAAANRWIVVGNNNALGKGTVDVQVGGVLTPDETDRRITNAFLVGATLNWGSTNLYNENGTNGPWITAGKLTVAGPITFDATAYNGNDTGVSVWSPVVFSGLITSGTGYPVALGSWGTKSGPGTLTLQSNTCELVQVQSDLLVNQGTLIFDHETVSITGTTQPNMVVACGATNQIAHLIITNGSSVLVGSLTDGNGLTTLRLGATGSPTNSLGQQCTTNLVDIYGGGAPGTIHLFCDNISLGYSGTNGFGSPKTNSGGGLLNQLNLHPGSVVCMNQFTIAGSNSTAPTLITFDGPTIMVGSSNASTSFLEGISNVYMLNGGLTLVQGSTNHDVHIRQGIKDGTAGGYTGGGGLTITNPYTTPVFDSTNTVYLDGVNSFTGQVHLLAGTTTLSGNGTIAGPVLIDAGSTYHPGGGANLGTNTLLSTLTLSPGSTIRFTINNTNSTVSYVTNLDASITTNYTQNLATFDQVVVNGTITAGGTLSVGNSGGNLVLGTIYPLFNKAVTGFTNVNLTTNTEPGGYSQGLVLLNKVGVNGSVVVTTNVTLTYANTAIGVTGGLPAAGPYPSGSIVTVLDNTNGLALTGYTFGGWTNSGGVLFAANSTFTITSNSTLYAKWNSAAVPVTLTYDGNTQSLGNPPVDVLSPYTSGATVTVLGNTGSPALVKYGSAFSGWNTAANGSGTPQGVGSTFTISANTTLYAQYSVISPLPKLTNSVAGKVFTFTWTADSSFHLQSATNTLNLGLKTGTYTWGNYPNGGTSPVSVTNNPADPAVFYRLSQ